MNAMTTVLTGPLPTGSGGPSVAVAAGLASAAAFATSNALQHRAAGTVPAAVHKALAVVAHLARQRAWVGATCLSFCALLLHAVALRIGSIALVQPLMLVGVVLAVPVRAALGHTLPRWHEMRAVGVTVLGLAVFVLSADPRPSDTSPGLVAVGAFALGCFAVGLGTLAWSRRPGRGLGRQAALLGAGAGVMFGATAGLLKLVGTALTSGGARPPVLLLLCAILVAAGLLGTAMNQRAYQIAPISSSMPLVNVVDILVAVLFGAVVFGELPGHTTVLLVAQATALVVVGLGLRMISTLRTPPPTASIAHGAHAGGIPRDRASSRLAAAPAGLLP